MRIRLAVTAALLSAALIRTATAEVVAPTEESAVRHTFEAYAAALAGKDGKAALALVDAATISYNAGLLEHARSSDKQVLDGLPMVDRLAVLRIRHEIPGAKLAKMKARELFRWGVEHGWSDAWKLDKAKIDTVSVSSDGNEGTVAMSGTRFGTTVTWKLLREQDQWRVSVVSVLPEVEALMKTMAKRFGKSEDELVVLALQMLVGADVAPTLWDPPQQ